MRYIALLAAINVGKRQMKMARLREIVGNLGFGNVGTYIQSGNLYFDAIGPRAEVRAALQTAIEAEFGFPVDTVLRTVGEFEAVLARAPFTTAQLGPDERQLIMFLRGDVAPPPALPLASADGSFAIVGADDDAWYMHITDARTWARSSMSQLKKIGLDVPHTGRWRHTSAKILDAATKG